jgi:hypothetical protein
MATAGLILSIIGLTATIVNSSIGAYQGANQISLIGDWVFEDELDYNELNYRKSYFSFVPENKVFGYFEGQFIGTYDDQYIKINHNDDPGYVYIFTYNISDGKLLLSIEGEQFILIKK